MERMRNGQDELEAVGKRISQANDIIIYGAGVIAYGIYKTIVTVYGVRPYMFVITQGAEIINRLEDIPVWNLGQVRDLCGDKLVLVATPEIYHQSIKVALDKLDISDSIYIDSHLEYYLMSQYYKEIGCFRLLEMEADFGDKDEKNWDIGKEFGIYMARCHLDPKLDSTVDLPKWVIPIQVGAALTEKRIAQIHDNTGDNISIKNRNYSELTATYWVWKNIHRDYKGICHYRRQLLFSALELNWLKQNDIDVVLPLPFVCYPNTKGQYRRYISENDQEILFQALREVSEEYAEAATGILERQHLYNYNILLAKESVFNDYCEWMFPILFYAEKLQKSRKQKTQDRFAGYFGEVLTSIYFLKNRNDLKIVHAEKKWYV